MIEEQIEKLRTLREGYDVLATSIETQLPAIADKIDNIDLTPIENKVDEGVSALSEKIDNIDLSSVAKQETLKEVAQAFGIISATEYEPMTEEEITNEINTLWEGL